MGKPAIIVENLSKKYQIGLKEKANRNFGEGLVDALKAPLRRLRTVGAKTDGEDTFWALKDVSFEVQPGEVVGIIGRNGAGKSTLLKILSRITEPTSGRATIHGRVGSLLEVGTGFHPELTGRENIYLNGAILGMKRAEITRKFDEIVAFSEIEKFLDTPVKRYSSGMYVRLAFAVAAHLEPEILIVDEVLAVGDAEFQKKCLGKMKDVAHGGRTVLFVSHNLDAITRICGRGVLLANGTRSFCGTSTETVAHYMDSLNTVQGDLTHSKDSPIEAVDIHINGTNRHESINYVSLPLEFTIDITLKHECSVPRVDFAIFRLDGTKLFGFMGDRYSQHQGSTLSRHWQAYIRLPTLALAGERIFFDLGIRSRPLIAYDVLWRHAVELYVDDFRRPDYLTPDSIMAPPVEFTCRSV